MTKQNIIDIVSCTETDGDAWYEVEYLAQDTIFQEVPNLIENEHTLFEKRPIKFEPLPLWT